MRMRPASAGIGIRGATYSRPYVCAKEFLVSFRFQSLLPTTLTVLLWKKDGA